MRVRHRATRGDAGPVVAGAVMAAVSAVITVTAIPALPGAIALVRLVVGVAGALLFTAGLVLMAGRPAARRVVLEPDGNGVRIPAQWPMPATRDRLLPWPEVAAAVVWNRPRPRGPRGVVVAFLPTPEGALRTGRGRASNSLAYARRTCRGSDRTLVVPMSLSWDTGMDEVIAALRGRAQAPTSSGTATPRRSASSAAGVRRSRSRPG